MMHYIISLYVFGISRMLHDVTSSSPQAPKKLMKLMINSPQAQKISILIHFHCFPELESSWPGNYMKTCISLKSFGNFTMHYPVHEEMFHHMTGAPKSPHLALPFLFSQGIGLRQFTISSATTRSCTSGAAVLENKKNQSDLRPLAS